VISEGDDAQFGLGLVPMIGKPEVRTPCFSPKPNLELYSLCPTEK